VFWFGERNADSGGWSNSVVINVSWTVFASLVDAIAVVFSECSVFKTIVILFIVLLSNFNNLMQDLSHYDCSWNRQKTLLSTPVLPA
jgi:uncharacterized membrane protein